MKYSWLLCTWSMVHRSDQTTSAMVPYDASMKLPHSSCPTSSQHVSSMPPILQNGRLQTVWLSPSLARSHIQIRNLTARSLFSPVLANYMKQLSQNISLRLPCCVVQLTPRKWEPNQKTQQLTHSCERSHPLRTLSAKRRPASINPHCLPYSHMTSKEHLTRSTRQHSKKSCTDARCQYTSPGGSQPSTLRGKWPLGLISSPNTPNHTDVAYHRGHRSHQFCFLSTATPCLKSNTTPPMPLTPPMWMTSA